MKTIHTFLLGFFLLSFGAVNAQTSISPTPVSNTDLIAWSTETYEFGSIAQAVPATAEFVLTNEGKQPIIITDVKKTCGCTVPAYSDEPIMPGESSTIKATYNAKKAGPFTKTIKVYTTLSDQPILLKLKGEVEKKEEAAVSAKPNKL